MRFLTAFVLGCTLALFAATASAADCYCLASGNCACENCDCAPAAGQRPGRVRAAARRAFAPLRVLRPRNWRGRGVPIFRRFARGC